MGAKQRSYFVQNDDQEILFFAVCSLFLKYSLVKNNKTAKFAYVKSSLTRHDRHLQRIQKSSCLGTNHYAQFTADVGSNYWFC